MQGLLTEDVAVSRKRNEASLRACEAIHARNPDQRLAQHIAALREGVAEMRDPANLSPGGTVWARSARTIRDDLDAIELAFARRVSVKISKAFR